MEEEGRERRERRWGKRRSNWEVTVWSGKSGK
jgi:hypothetical protein